MERNPKRGVDEHKHCSRSDGDAGSLRVSGAVGGGVAIGSDGLFVEKGTGVLPLTAPQVRVQIFSTSLSFFTGKVPACWGHGRAIYAAELSACSVEGPCDCTGTRESTGYEMG